MSPLSLRDADAGDLETLNAVVEAAVDGWRLAPRVRDLAIREYRYAEHDLEHMRVRVLEAEGRLVGVHAIEPAEGPDALDGDRTLLLHGIHVHPDVQGTGLGRRLLEDALICASAAGASSLVVRAQRQARGFFDSVGAEAVPVRDHARDYPHRYRFVVTTA